MGWGAYVAHSVITFYGWNLFVADQYSTIFKMSPFYLQAAPVMEDLWTTNAGNPIISAGHESPRSESNVTSVAKLNTFDYQGKKTLVS